MPQFVVRKPFRFGGQWRERGEVLDLTTYDNRTIARLMEQDLVDVEPSGSGASVTPQHWAVDGEGALSGVSIQGTWNVTYLSGRVWMENASGRANGDAYEWPVALDAGTYTLRFMYITNTASGVTDIDLDGVEVGSVDTYSASVTYENVYTVTGIVVAEAGVLPLRVRIGGTVGGDYLTRVQAISLVRTGA